MLTPGYNNYAGAVPEIILSSRGHLTRCLKIIAATSCLISMIGY